MKYIIRNDTILKWKDYTNILIYLHIPFLGLIPWKFSMIYGLTSKVLLRTIKSYYLEVTALLIQFRKYKCYFGNDKFKIYDSCIVY